MIDILEFMRQYAAAIIGVGQIFIFVAILYLRGKFASKDLEIIVEALGDHAKENFSQIEQRVMLLEERGKELPTQRDIHNLKLEIKDLSGEMKKMEQSFHGTEGILVRVERQVKRIEDFLMKGP